MDACPPTFLHDTLMILGVLVILMTAYAVHTFIEEHFYIAGRLEDIKPKPCAPPDNKSAEVNEFLKCHICLLNERTVRFSCGHIPCCTTCLDLLPVHLECPVCRRESTICLATYM